MDLRDLRIEAYLNHACRWIFSRKKRENVRLELLSHIEEAIFEKREQGLSEESAVVAVLLQMGSPKMLSRQLGYTHRPVIFRLPFLAASVACILVVGTVFTIEETGRLFRKMTEQQAQIVGSHLERFVADEKALSADPLFSFPGLLHDAGPTLNPIVTWSSGERDLQKFLPTTKALFVDEVTERKLRGTIWPDADIDVSKFDTRWMSSLQQFDHWNIFDSGPLQKIFEANPSQNFWSLPIPNYSILQTWIRIRLLQGLRGNDMLAALRDVRLLSRLIYSNQFLISSVIYASTLDVERLGYETAVKRGKLKSGDWTPIEPDQLIRARRALYAYPGIFDLWTDPETLKRVLNSGEAIAGMCSALQEKVAMLSLSRLFYEGNPLYAKEFDAKFQLIDSIFSQTRSRCQISKHFLNVWDHPELAATWISPTSISMGPRNFSEIFKWEVLARIPYARSWVGAEVEGIADANYISGPYRKWFLEGEEKIKE